MDGNVKKNLTDADIRPYDGPCMQRGDMIDKNFHFDGEEDCPAGLFKARRLVGNAYQCIRLSGGGVKEKGQLEEFDVGYVLRVYQAETERMREEGEGEILNSRHRSRQFS